MPYRGGVRPRYPGHGAGGAHGPLFPALMKPMLNDGFGGRDRSKPGVDSPAALIGIFVLRGIVTFSTSYALAWVSNRILMDMRNAMFERPVRLPTTFFNNQASGILISRVAFDVNNVTWPPPRCSRCWCATRSPWRACSPGCSTRTGASRW